jgi:hypothetical protein
VTTSDHPGRRLFFSPAYRPEKERNRCAQ